MGAQKCKRVIGSKALQALPSALLFVLVLWHELPAVSHHVHHHFQLQAPTHSGAGSLRSVLPCGRSRAESHSAIDWC